MSPRPTRLTVALLSLSAVAACGGGSEGASDGAAGRAEDARSEVVAAGPADAQTVTVDTLDTLRFNPERVTAKVGTVALTLTNTGGVPHNLVFDDPGLAAIDTVTGGQSRTQSYTFTAPGTYDFVCTFHSGMDGQVVVTAAGG